MLFPAYLLIGAVTGFFAGLFGIGGGTIIVPMLLILLPRAGVPDAQLMAMALGTSFSTIVFTSISSAWQHRKLGNVDFRVFRHLVPSLMASVFVCGYLVSGLPKAHLMKMFAAMMLLLAIKMLIASKQKTAPPASVAKTGKAAPYTIRWNTNWQKPPSSATAVTNCANTARKTPLPNNTGNTSKRSGAMTAR